MLHCIFLFEEPSGIEYGNITKKKLSIETLIGNEYSLGLFITHVPVFY